MSIPPRALLDQGRGLTRRALCAASGAGLAFRGAEGGAATACSVATDRLRCEHLSDPVGIDSPAPRLSWEVVAVREEHGAAQSAYRIRVASSREALLGGAADLWDSGRVGSAASFGIEYAGARLASGQDCWWTVALWDQAGRPAPPALPARWVMGLLDPVDWHAAWICWEDRPDPPPLLAAWIGYAGEGRAELDHVQYYRRELTLPGNVAPAGAVLLVAADAEAAVFANDVWVGSVTGAAAVTRLELPAMVAGPLVLAITVGHRGGSLAPTALIARLEIRCEDGQRLVTATGDGWVCADWALPDWKRPGFDARAWPGARLLDPATCKPVPGPVPTDGPGILLRREFDLPSRPCRALLHASGLGWSEFQLNGARVGDAVLSPGLTDYAKRVPVVSHDVTALLRPGANAIGALLGNGRFRAPRPSARDYGTPRLLLQLDIEHADGARLRIGSDTAWRASDAGPIRTNNEYDGETIDARMAQRGWAEPGFDDAGWRPARTATPPAGRLAGCAAEPSRVTARLPPRSITRSRDGWIVDFGQNLAGVCRLAVEEAAGAEIVIRHAERLRDGQLDVANLRSAAATDRFISAGRPATFQPSFTTHGFRYAEVSGLSRPPDAAMVACVIGDDLRRTGQFTCSDAVLTRVHEAIAWTTRANMRSIRTDCPQRDERQGWLGDPGEEAGGEAYLFDVAAFYAKWMRDVADAQAENGDLPDVAPAFWSVDPGDVAWPAAFVAIPSMLARHFGDRRTLALCLPGMVRWLDHLLAGAVDGIVKADAYGDWGAPPEDRGLTHPTDPSLLTSGPLIATAMLVHCLDTVARLGPPEAPRLIAEAARLREAFHAHFFDPVAGWYDNGTATACILPLAFGLVPAAYRSTVARRLVQRITATGEPAPCFGLVGAQWASRTLAAIGRDDLVLGMATRTAYPGFGHMLDQGATTIWELWNGDTAPAAMNSLNHTMLTGDLLVWLYGHVLGLQAAEPGFARSVVAPHLVPGLAWAEGHSDTPHGRLASSWRLAGDRVEVAVEVPANTEASFVAPPGWMPPGGDALGSKRLQSGAHRFVLTRHGG